MEDGETLLDVRSGSFGSHEVGGEETADFAFEELLDDLDEFVAGQEEVEYLRVIEGVSEGVVGPVWEFAAWHFWLLLGGFFSSVVGDMNVSILEILIDVLFVFMISMTVPLPTFYFRCYFCRTQEFIIDVLLVNLCSSRTFSDISSSSCLYLVVCKRSSTSSFGSPNICLKQHRCLRRLYNPSAGQEQIVHQSTQ